MTSDNRKMVIKYNGGVVLVSRRTWVRYKRLCKEVRGAGMRSKAVVGWLGRGKVVIGINLFTAPAGRGWVRLKGMEVV